MTLYYWVQENDIIKKELLYCILKRILKQLFLFHKQAECVGYGTLDPDHIIIAKDYKIFLQNPDQKSGEKHILCEKYFKSDRVDKLSSDIYNYGKIIQFLLAHLECEPELTKWEEFKFQNYIEKCLDTENENGYHNLLQLQTKIPKLEKKKTKKISSKRKIRLFLKCTILMLFLIMLIISFQDHKTQLKDMEAETQESAMEELYEEDKELFDTNTP